MCKCCTGGKNASKYKKFAFLNEHHHEHGKDHSHGHGHDHDPIGTDRLQAKQNPSTKKADKNLPAKEV